MRWPLRTQILIRMFLLLFVTMAAITWGNIQSTVSSSANFERAKAERLLSLIQTSRFPLTGPILENMKALSGAEFVLVSRGGRMIEQTKNAPSQLPSDPVSGTVEEYTSDRPYYHASVADIQRRNHLAPAGSVHIFVPRQTAASVWWQAAKSPLLIALFAFPVALLLSYAFASQVTQPLASLQNQVKKIAQGDLTLLPETDRNDEIRDLQLSVNEMTTQLKDQEAQLRRNEQLRTMVQFGNSIAHHLRNSATGCKMAVELLGTENEAVANSENHAVALRQLELMNNYIKKFLLLSKTQQPGSHPKHDIDLAATLEKVEFLVRPTATHHGIELTCDIENDGSLLRINQDDAEQLMMNLVTNAIAAASARLNAADGVSQSSSRGIVDVKLVVNRQRVLFQVADNGAGPPSEIAESLFEPFVTGSREGTGLGLALVNDIAERTNADVSWKRENDTTTFTFEIKDPDTNSGLK